MQPIESPPDWLPIRRYHFEAIDFQSQLGVIRCSNDRVGRVTSNDSRLTSTCGGNRQVDHFVIRPWTNFHTEKIELGRPSHDVVRTWVVGDDVRRMPWFACEVMACGCDWLRLQKCF